MYSELFQRVMSEVDVVFGIVMCECNVNKKLVVMLIQLSLLMFRRF